MDGWGIAGEGAEGKDGMGEMMTGLGTERQPGDVNAGDVFMPEINIGCTNVERFIRSHSRPLARDGGAGAACRAEGFLEGIVMRIVSASVLVLALSIVAVTPTSTGSAQDPKAVVHKLTAEQEDCVKTAASCALQCEICQRHCSNLLAAGETKHANTMRLCQDCAEFCSLSARMVARRGPTWQLAIDTCAKVCDACAKRCMEFSDDHMKRCGKSCQDCAKSCRSLLATAKKK